MRTAKVELKGAKETLLITLHAKAEESRMPGSLLKDHFAAEAAGHLDYDFSKLKVGRNDMIGLAMRAHALDGLVRAFLASHPEATVLHLGCGLDSRVFRVDPPPSVRWFDVDYPEVIALRRSVYPERAGYTLIGSSLTDAHWLDQLPSDGPAMVVAEGVLPYLGKEDVPRLFGRLVAHLSSGEIAFDGYNELGLWLIARSPMVKATGATLHWSIGDPHELERQVKGLEFVQEIGVYDAAQSARFSWGSRLAIRIFAAVPVFRRIGRLLRYRFGQRPASRSREREPAGPRPA